MNLGEEIKKEIFLKTVKERPLQIAFIAGIIRSTGVLFEEDGALGLYFTVTGEERAFKVAWYLERLFNYQVREIDVKEDRLNKKERFEISISGNAAQEILSELGIISLRNGEINVEYDFYGKIINDTETFRAFLRGLFVGSGSCTVPDEYSATGTGYHLELIFSHPITAESTALRLSEHGLNGKIIRRKESYVLYFKSAEAIKDFIAFLPAAKAVLKFTEVMVRKEFINDVNRKKNCDLGNVTRQVNASVKIIDAIETLKEKGRLEELKKDLYETAVKKLQFPDDSYEELAARLSVTKSCLNHRFRKIIETAAKAKEQRG